MIEQRTHPRTKASADVTVKVQSAPGIAALEGKSYHCKTLDISSGGVCLETDVIVPVGEFLELSIILASQTYWHYGEVVWSSKEANQKGQYLAGISFDDVKNPQLDSWRSAIKELHSEG